MRLLHSQLAPPCDGVLYLLENNFLNNADQKTGKFPAGEPIEYFLFMGASKNGEFEWFIHTITTLNQKTADQEILNIADRDDVILIESRRTLNVVQKDWQGKTRSRILAGENVEGGP